MSDELEVRMLTSMASMGGGLTLQVDEKRMLPRGIAIALCTEPSDYPRAEPVGWKVEDVVKTKARTATAKPKTERAVDPAAPKPED